MKECDCFKCTFKIGVCNVRSSSNFKILCSKREKPHKDLARCDEYIPRDKEEK